jgi:anti-sigma regulatory factor (Ser/Thr protein kinase)
MKESFDIKIPSNPRMMQLVRKTIAQACEMVGFSEREVHGVTLAVDEGCTNIIRHSYQGSETSHIIIRVRLYDDRIEIVLRDFGNGIDVEKLRKCVEKRKRELERSGPVRPGGLGVMLIHSIMDKVHYKTSQNSGTVLRLVKYLSDTREKKIAGNSRT